MGFPPPFFMPGAVVILGLFITIALVAWMAAWAHTRDPSNRDPREDYRQLQRQTAWLEQRLDLARREKWSPEMIQSLEQKLGAACDQLGRARGGILVPRPVRRA
ncbi:MAG: hypothetical protein RIQ93_2677 [Verrucomicrobiota bacterium]|jgi:hypothetical protein